MEKMLPVVLATALFACCASNASAADLKIGANDSVQSALAGQKGTRVTVRTRSGQDITGAVREVNANVVQLGAVGGKEFFDAVVPLSAIDAIYVRVKE
jgi:opacity protein-like surface antigen